MKYWNQSEVFDSSGTLALQGADHTDLMYCSKVEHEDKKDDLTDEKHQDWINLISAAPKTLTLLQELLHYAETPGDFTKEEADDLLTEASRLVGALESSDLEELEQIHLTETR